MDTDESTSAVDGGSVLPDKVDMSLDEIIRLNRREEQQLRRRRRSRAVKRNGLMTSVPRTAGRGLRARSRYLSPRLRATEETQRLEFLHKGGAGGGPKLRNGRLPPSRGQRRGQGGVAGRRAAVVRRRSGTVSRTTVQQRTRLRAGPFPQRPDVPYRKSFVVAETIGSPFTLWRRSLQQSQKETRQATFVLRRGLKVQTTLHRTCDSPAPPPRWRSAPPPGGSTGILTVSIDNPSARTQPEPPHAWTLHPPAPGPAPVTMETVEKKVPRGVVLQFDINSVSKPQTSMTLNERFRILKDQRSAATQSSKGGRFVTVG